VKNNSEYFRSIPFVEMNVSKLINYSTDMCWNGQGIITVFTRISKQQEWENENPKLFFECSWPFTDSMTGSGNPLTILHFLSKGRGSQLKSWTPSWVKYSVLQIFANCQIPGFPILRPHWNCWSHWIPFHRNHVQSTVKPAWIEHPYV